MAAAGPIEPLVSAGNAINRNFFEHGYPDEEHLSIAKPNAHGDYYDITIIYDGDNHIYINNSAGGSNCVELEIKPDNIYLASLLYNINDAADPCKQIDGATYLNLVLVISKLYTRQTVNPDDGSLKNKYISLIDAASKPLVPGLDDVELSLLQLFEKGRTYYEAYGFLPEFIVDDDENNILPFNSQEYLDTLDAFLKFRNSFINNKIKHIPRYAFSHDRYSLKPSDNVKPIRQIINKLDRDIRDDTGSSIKDRVSLKEVYDIAKADSVNTVTAYLGKLAYNKLNIIGHLSSNYHYTYPIITRAEREAILQVYLHNRINSIKPQYSYFILSDNLHGSSGNTTKTKLRRFVPGMGIVRENVQPHVDPFIVDMHAYIDALSQENLDELLAGWLPEPAVYEPVNEAGAATGPLIRLPSFHIDMLPNLPSNIDMRVADVKKPRRRLSRGQQRTKKANNSGSGGRRTSRSRSRSPVRRHNSGSSERRTRRRNSSGRRSRSRSPPPRMSSFEFENFIRRGMSPPGGYYSPPGSPRTP
jgi:hypothetical protein